ncbi:hypothetical protein [Magnetospirillum sp. 15-1]|uniref:hypothetical protein n=1 Tax=Magnetospirillum sp. 15-1 TaxID=1979370 RepID=UPI001143983B|nr:hypothetical protein [Magnetospirillum sp. 15-1]
MRRKVLAVCALLTFLSSPAWSQTSPTPTTQPNATPAQQDMIAIPVWPTAAVPLPDSQPAPVSFAMGKIDGISPELVSGVTAKGYARKVSVEGQSVGQVLVTTVARGDREEIISTDGLSAQFDAKGANQLFPEKTVEVQGSKTALVAALERLATPKKEAAKTELPKDEKAQNAVGASQPKNDLAAGYQSPTVSATPAPEQKDPVTDNRVTTEGCSVRVDMTQELAIQQSKLQTFTDGTLTTDGSCTDSDTKFPIKRSYATCPIDILDLAKLQAWPQYTLYYVDTAGETHTVSECAKDGDSPYMIVEDESQCPISLDFANAKAVPQAALIYTNRNNAPVQARGCADSTKSAAIPMTESVLNCPLRNDFAASKSYERSMWTYTRNGLTYQAAPCGDTGRVFSHETVYADLAGAYICTPITNMTTKTVILQSRKRVTIDDVPQFITDCTPDTSTKGIFSTTDGCMDPSKWTHDIANSVSYGQERFWYAKADGSREYVTQCQNSTVTYPHSVTITGYQYHDDQRWAYPLSTITISVNGTPYTVASSGILAGAPQIPYVLDSTQSIPDGTTTNEGCQTYQNTVLTDIYKRPDDTIYSVPKGVGTPIAVPGTPLAGGTHTDVSCCNAGGTVTAVGGGVSICRFSQPFCPSGWSAYQNWMTTGINTCQTTQGSCSGGDGGCSMPLVCSSCTAPAHGFSNSAPGTCSYATQYSGSSWDSSYYGCDTGTRLCSATILEIGCR